MESFAAMVGAVIAAAPSEPPNFVSERLHVGSSTPSVWKTRDNIPPEYWSAFLALARELGVEGITEARMIELAAAKRKVA